MARVTKFFDYIVNGGTERDRILAEADYCRSFAKREREGGDPMRLANELEEDAARLEAEAALQ